MVANVEIAIARRFEFECGDGRYALINQLIKENFFWRWELGKIEIFKNIDVCFASKVVQSIARAGHRDVVQVFCRAEELEVPAFFLAVVMCGERVDFDFLARV